MGWSALPEIHIALSSPPSHLNPFFSTESNSQNIGRLVHLALIDFDADMRVQCRLCESFSEQHERGQYQLVFQLKKGVRFWDGQEIKAQDVANAIQLFQTEHEAIKSIFRFAFSKIKQARVLSEDRISLEYEQFALSHLPDLVLLKILKLKRPLNEYKKVELSDIVGSGPYRLGPMTPFRIELHPNSEGLHPLTFKIVKDETTLALKLLNQGGRSLPLRHGPAQITLDQTKFPRKDQGIGED